MKAKLIKYIFNYCNIVRQGLFTRWKLFKIDLSKGEFYEVIGGLLSRQANLTIQLAQNPGIWNPHVSPIFFRTQIDAYITLAWILEKDSLLRAQNYITYGLGQEKLQIEHLQASIREEISDEEKSNISAFIDLRKHWLNEQLFEFLTEVNIGSWSGKSTREMAEEAGCIDLYNYSYLPFSSAVHSMWPHVSRHDLRKCKNSLHKKHRIPFVKDRFDFNFDDLLKSAKYVQKAYCLIDKKMKIFCKVPLPNEYLHKILSKY